MPIGDRGDEGFWYGLYTTWSENEDILWQEFALMTAGVSWGIGYMTFFHPISEPTHRGLPVSFIGGENPPSNSAVSPVPEPAPILLLGSGLLGLVGFRRKSKVFSNFSDSANWFVSLTVNFANPYGAFSCPTGAYILKTWSKHTNPRTRFQHMCKSRTWYFHKINIWFLQVPGSYLWRSSAFATIGIRDGGKTSNTGTEMDNTRDHIK